MNYLLIAIIVSFFILYIIIQGTSAVHKCKPHCSGILCGPNSDDGCGNTCSCEDGICQQNGKCCYPNCDGLHCGTDPCNGETCDCTIIPNGQCNQQTKRCCYKQDCNNVYCGDDGCGGNCNCLPGSTCSNSSGGICSNSGVLNWTYNILSTPGKQRSNQNSPLQCASWLPQNITNNILNFPCSEDNDCPKGDKCVQSTNGKFCNKNNVYQYWIYDPSDPSGYNCTKLLQGSSLCGVQKEGASAFDIIENIGPDQQQCNNLCTILPSCPSTGINACCPQNWNQPNNNTSLCNNSKGITQCCLNNPNLTDYNSCINSGHPSCENIPNNWWIADLAEIQNGICGVQISGGNIQINRKTLQDPAFSNPCINKYASDTCNYQNNGISYSGICKSCNIDGIMRCLPDRMCVSNFTASNQQGTCSSATVC